MGTKNKTIPGSRRDSKGEHKQSVWACDWSMLYNIDDCGKGDKYKVKAHKFDALWLFK